MSRKDMFKEFEVTGLRLNLEDHKRLIAKPMTERKMSKSAYLRFVLKNAEIYEQYANLLESIKSTTNTILDNQNADLAIRKMLEEN